MSNEIKDSTSTTLLIHLGGLGDICLSESTFLSLAEFFKGNIEAVGYTRFFSLFTGYFSQIHRIESIKWLHLFSDNPTDIRYKRIIFIGKDREDRLRKRWQGLSKEPLIFIDMYPGNGSNGGKKNPTSTAKIHVEDYQLLQLAQYGIKPIIKQIEPKPLQRIILYPEPVFRKEKWPPEKFMALYQSLRSKGVAVYILEPLGLKLDIKEKYFFEDLAQIKAFFRDGGVFVSNDSGVAHLAGIHGLFTITIFADFDPSVWHPRGRCLALEQHKIAADGQSDVSFVEGMILEIMEGNAKQKIHGKSQEPDA